MQIQRDYYKIPLGFVASGVNWWATRTDFGCSAVLFDSLALGSMSMWSAASWRDEGADDDDDNDDHQFG